MLQLTILAGWTTPAEKALIRRAKSTNAVTHIIRWAVTKQSTV